MSDKWTDRQVIRFSLHAAWSWFDSLAAAYPANDPEALDAAKRRDAVGQLLLRRYREKPVDVQIREATGETISLTRALVLQPRQFSAVLARAKEIG